MEYRICSRCIIDTDTYPEIVFDEYGVCNVCHTYDDMAAKFKMQQEVLAEKFLLQEIEKMKANGKGKEYDCLLGLSGGVDSSYLAIKLKEWGLRPLILHVDNGWNTEIAVSNIEKLVKQLNMDLITYVVDWGELRDLELSYLKASVVDIDIPNEMCSHSVIHQKAAEFNLKYIITGHNYASEGWLPPSFSHYKYDTLNMFDIHRRFGKVKLKKYPRIGFFRTIYYQKIRGIQFFSPLNYIEYDKEKAKQLLINTYGWKDYGGKHFENSYTRFYQSYILPEKFKLDKRRSHYSSLICAGQLGRNEALEMIKKPPYSNSELLRYDKEYFMKKLRISEQEFAAYIAAPPIPHTHYWSYMNIYSFLKKYFFFLKPFFKRR